MNEKERDLNHLDLWSFKTADDPSLRKLPEFLPDTEKIEIYDLNNTILDNDPRITPFHVHSFKDLPKSLPKLKIININNSILTNFEDLTAEMPVLKNITLINCKIHNFIGFPPNIALNIHRSTIDSVEGLQFFVPKNNLEELFCLSNSTIRSLGGISRPTIQTILIAILNMDFPEKKYNDNVEIEDPEFHKNRLHQIKLDLPPTAIKLIKNSINLEIERIYSPKHHRNWIFNYEFYQTHWHEWKILLKERPDSKYSYTQKFEDASQYDWIYGFGLQEKLFYPEKLDILHEYYRKTTRQLAQKYIADRSSLAPEQIERLIHEIDPQLRELLENNLPPTDPVIVKISSKFSFSSVIDLKILK
ncbi:MAG: hypothetical protein ACTSWX_06520 [Promethearchaeota archaeon]